MLSIPSAYQFTPKDLTGASIEWRTLFLRTASANATQSFSGTFPFVDPDRIWFITHFSARGIPGATQSVLSSIIIVQQLTGAAGALQAGVFHSWTNPKAPVADQVTGPTDQLSFALPPGHRLSGDVIFNAGVASNTAEWYFAGWSVPRANIQVISSGAIVPPA